MGQPPVSDRIKVVLLQKENMKYWNVFEGIEMFLKDFKLCIFCLYFMILTNKIIEINHLKEKLFVLLTEKILYSVRVVLQKAADASVLWKKVFLRISQNSRRTPEWESLFKLSSRPGLQLFWKRDADTGVFLWILRNFSKHFFHRTSTDDCFCTWYDAFM